MIGSPMRSSPRLLCRSPNSPCKRTSLKSLNNLFISWTYQRSHGVNTAEGVYSHLYSTAFHNNWSDFPFMTDVALKSEALAWRFTADPTDIQSTIDRLDMLYQYHGMVSGTFSADEHIAGLNPSRGWVIYTSVSITMSLIFFVEPNCAP